ncbi:MAG: ribulose-phosphate 3-epimerase [bacterium]
MAEILPSILTNEYQVLERQVRAAERFAPALHIDIADGRFVPSLSITLADVRMVAPAIPFELHLMIQRPEEVILDGIATGTRRMIIHRTATDAPEDCFSAIRRGNCEAALAVSPETLSADIAQYLALIDQVTFLSEEPGFQGGMLVPGVLQKARQFHFEHPEVFMEVDGGMRMSNIGNIVATGAQRFVIGSAIWRAADPAAVYRQFIAQIQQQLSSSNI